MDRPGASRPDHLVTGPRIWDDHRVTRFPAVLAVSAAALVLLAACGGSAAPAADISPSPAPAASTPSAPSTPDVVAAAADRECARFTAAYKVIRHDTAEDGIVAELMGTVDLHGHHWGVLLRKAGHVPDTVPVGYNRARILAVKIAKANLAVGMVTLYSVLAGTNVPKINPAWLKAQRLLAKVADACRYG